MMLGANGLKGNGNHFCFNDSVNELNFIPTVTKTEVD